MARRLLALISKIIQRKFPDVVKFRRNVGDASLLRKVFLVNQAGLVTFETSIQVLQILRHWAEHGVWLSQRGLDLALNVIDRPRALANAFGN